MDGRETEASPQTDYICELSTREYVARSSTSRMCHLLTWERDLPDEEVLVCLCSILLGGVPEAEGGSGCLTAMTCHGEREEERLVLMSESMI
jgi:hypothetical protein